MDIGAQLNRMGVAHQLVTDLRAINCIIAGGGGTSPPPAEQIGGFLPDNQEGGTPLSSFGDSSFTYLSKQIGEKLCEVFGTCPSTTGTSVAIGASTGVGQGPQQGQGQLCVQRGWWWL